MGSGLGANARPRLNSPTSARCRRKESVQDELGACHHLCRQGLARELRDVTILGHEDAPEPCEVEQRRQAIDQAIEIGSIRAPRKPICSSGHCSATTTDSRDSFEAEAGIDLIARRSEARQKSEARCAGLPHRADVPAVMRF